jgi:hypothetical protein
MGLFTSSIAVIQQPGVFLIEVASPTIIDGVPNGYVGIVGQGEWGPVNAMYIPTSGADMLNTYFPAGTPHNSTMYYAMMRRKQVPWAVNRILGGNQGLQPPKDITAVVTGTPGATTYRYTVTALNATGESMASQEVIVTTGNATLTGGNHNDLSWTAVTGATGYSVYRTVSGGTPSSTGKIATNQAGVTLNDTGLAAAGASPASNASGWNQSICNILDTNGVAVLRLTGLQGGTLLNSSARASAVVAAATDGVANHYKLTITLTDSITGSTTEVYDNLQTIATAIMPSLTTSILLSSAALINTPITRPLNGTYTFYNGSNGAAVSAADYNTGLGNLATSQLIRFVGIDDCGDTIRAATNANVQAHVDAKTDRMCGLQGSPLNALAAVLTDVANYRDDRVIYCGSWVNVNDDAGTPQQSPFWTFVASAIANLEPQQSHAWWDDRVTTFYKGIASIPTTVLNTADDGTRNQCTANGVCLPIRLDSGLYAALHDRTTNLAVNKRFSVTRRIKDYLALSIRAGIPGFVNGPNTVDNQRALRNSIDDFLTREVGKGRLAAAPASAAVPNPVAYSIDAKSQNTASSVAAGQFILVINATTPAPMEQIIVLMNVGNTVVVTAL